MEVDGNASKNINQPPHPCATHALLSDDRGWPTIKDREFYASTNGVGTCFLNGYHRRRAMLFVEYEAVEPKKAPIAASDTSSVA